MALSIVDPATHHETAIVSSQPPCTRPWPLWVRIGILVVSAALFFAALPVLSNLSFEEDVTNWLPADDFQARLLKYHHEHFPTDETVLIAWDGASLGDPRIEQLAQSLRELDWVNRAITPQDLIARMTEARVPEDVARDRLRGLLLGRDAKNTGEIPAGLVVTFDDAKKNILQERIAAIREHAAQIGIPLEDLHLGGGPVAGSALDARLEQTRWNPEAPWYRPDQRSPLLLSTVVALLLAIVLLRQIRLMILVLGMTLLATLLAVAQLPLTDTPMNMVLTVLPPLLLVLTLSATIHVANYWRHATTTTTHRAIAAVVAQRTAFWPCLFAAVTTAIGLASLLTSPLRPVRDFGLYSSTGVLIGLAAALFALPSALSLIPIGHPRPPGKEAAFWARLGRDVYRYANPLAVACLAIAIVASSGLIWFQTETRVISYFPEESRIVEDYRFLERHLAGITPVDLIVTFDESAQQRLSLARRIEIVREIEQAVRQNENVSGTLALPDFLPRVADLGVLGRTEYVRRRLPRLVQAIQEDSDPEIRRFVTQAQRPFIDDQNIARIGVGDELWQIDAQVDVLSNPNYKNLTGDLARSVNSILAEVEGTELLITGTVPLFLRTQQAVLNSLIVSFGIAFGIIAVTLMIALRSIPAGILTMLPNLLPIAVVFGAISWSGQAFDIGMMITASVALGIAVDGTLHLLTWFREGLAAGRTPEEAIGGALSHCGPAMWQTSGIIGFSLLMLAFSDLLLIRRFGWLMAALIFAALLADLIFLTALLGGRFGYLVRPQQTTTPRATTTTNEPSSRRERQASST